MGVGEQMTCVSCYWRQSSVLSIPSKQTYARNQQPNHSNVARCLQIKIFKVCLAIF